MTVELFGEKLFAPILVGPVARLGTLRAAREDRGLEPRPATGTRSTRRPTWRRVLTRVQRASAAGLPKVMVVTVGTPYRPTRIRAAHPTPGETLSRKGYPGISWAAMDQLRKAAKRPVVALLDRTMIHTDKR